MALRFLSPLPVITWKNMREYFRKDYMPRMCESLVLHGSSFIHSPLLKLSVPAFHLASHIFMGPLFVVNGFQCRPQKNQP